MSTLAGDLVSTLSSVFSGHFYPSVAPANVVPPYAVYQRISGAEEAHLDGATNLTNARFQVSIFGREKLALDVLVESAKAAMLAATLFKSSCLNEMDEFQDPSILYGILLDFSVWRNG